MRGQAAEADLSARSVSSAPAVLVSSHVPLFHRSSDFPIARVKMEMIVRILPCTVHLHLLQLGSRRAGNKAAVAAGALGTETGKLNPDKTGWKCLFVHTTEILVASTGFIG